MKITFCGKNRVKIIFELNSLDNISICSLNRLTISFTWLWISSTVAFQNNFFLLLWTISRRKVFEISLYFEANSEVSVAEYDPDLDILLTFVLIDSTSLNCCSRSEQIAEHFFTSGRRVLLIYSLDWTRTFSKLVRRDFFFALNKPFFLSFNLDVFFNLVAPVCKLTHGNF